MVRENTGDDDDDDDYDDYEDDDNDDNNERFADSPRANSLDLYNKNGPKINLVADSASAAHYI